MNALFNAIKDRGNIALANDGRLLKKSFSKLSRALKSMGCIFS